ncbi:MAG TPA: hypothetical protein PLI98_17715 [Candidatus Hydrogenedentes bacterium]|nr:hypothetical protein [Candidatus Hydrogenedentota bacterium]
MTDEEQEPRGEGAPRELRRDDETPVREFILGVMVGVALLIPGCLLSGFAVVGSYGVLAMSADRISAPHYAMTVVFTVASILVMLVWVYEIVRAFRRHRPYLGLGIAAVLPVLLLFFGVCTNAVGRPIVQPLIPGVPQRRELRPVSDTSEDVSRGHSAWEARVAAVTAPAGLSAMIRSAPGKDAAVSAGQDRGLQASTQPQGDRT